MEIKTDNVPHAYYEVLNRIKLSGIKEESRNGTVYTIPEPFLLTIRNPRERVLFSRARRANPFFHVYETVWMLAGANTVQPLLHYNAKYIDFAEPGSDKVHGAYGHRWLVHFGRDQIHRVIQELADNPESRRAVIGMWDPAYDQRAPKRDVPCNTHIYFRIIKGALDMTVCNRSNDVIWGMMGANAVHMTILQEIIAAHVGVQVGHYHVMTNNAHFYPDLYPNAAAILDEVGAFDEYILGLDMTPIVAEGEEYFELLADCQHLTYAPGSSMDYSTKWIRQVVLPMVNVWGIIKAGGTPTTEELNTIQAEDWRKGCEVWLATRKQ